MGPFRKLSIQRKWGTESKEVLDTNAKWNRADVGSVKLGLSGGENEMRTQTRHSPHSEIKTPMQHYTVCVALTTGALGPQPGAQGHGLGSWTVPRPFAGRQWGLSLLPRQPSKCAWERGASEWLHQRQLGNLTFFFVLRKDRRAGGRGRGRLGKGSGLGALKNLKCPVTL